MSVPTPKIMPCLWFDNRIEEAVNFYIGLFGDGVIHHIQKMPDGTVLVIRFRLRGQEFMALNGQQTMPSSDLVSFSIDCADQAEVDHFWYGLLADGGTESMCGWLRDRYGFSWQVVPRQMPDLIGGPDPAGAARAMQTMLKMRRLVIADLEAAYRG